MENTSLLCNFKKAVEKNGNLPFLGRKNTTYEWITYSQVYERSKNFMYKISNLVLDYTALFRI